MCSLWANGLILIPRIDWLIQCSRHLLLSFSNNLFLISLYNFVPFTTYSSGSWWWKSVTNSSLYFCRRLIGSAEEVSGGQFVENGNLSGREHFSCWSDSWTNLSCIENHQTFKIRKFISLHTFHRLIGDVEPLFCEQTLDYIRTM